MRIMSALVLFPLSLLYGGVIWFRNLLFNRSILKQHTFSLPVICVGNITVGGTGKTPHVEHIVELVKNQYEVAVLSRGYKRKSKGFHLADEYTSLEELGDEAFMLHQKQRDAVRVAVDKDRVRGIRLLQQKFPSLDAVIMDDGYQHRHVKAGMNVLLTDYTRPMFYDFLLPYGRLREFRFEKYRANVIIVTKVPADVKPIDIRIFKKKLKAKPYQHVFFSTIKYDRILQPAFSLSQQESMDFDALIKAETSCLLLTGIANPKPLWNYLDDAGIKLVGHVKLSDHQDFTDKHIRKIMKYIDMEPNLRIITTEKDAARLRFVEKQLPEILKSALLIMPMKVGFMSGHGERFKSLLLEYLERGHFPSRLSR